MKLLLQSVLPALCMCRSEDKLDGEVSAHYTGDKRKQWEALKNHEISAYSSWISNVV